MAMSREWKQEIQHLMHQSNVRHRCTSSHAFMTHLGPRLRQLVVGRERPEQLVACVNRVPMVFSTIAYSTNEYAVLFLWDQSPDDVSRALATLLLRKPSTAKPCVCYVAKAVRNHFGHSSAASSFSPSSVQLARFIDVAMEGNVHV